MAKGKRSEGPVIFRKTAERLELKEALGKALEGRAKQLGLEVKDVTGLGLNDVRPPAGKIPAGTQGFLFGEGDKIRAALSSELVIINAEIGAAEKSKMNINEKIDCLTTRRRVVEDAMLALDKVKDKKKPAKKATNAEKSSKPDKKKQQSEPKPNQEKKAS